MPPPQQKKTIGKIIFGQKLCKIRALFFSDKYNIKFRNFVKFYGSIMQNLGILLIFHAYIFGQKCIAPKSTELLCLCTGSLYKIKRHYRS